MKNNKIVVALGRNAFGETFPEQKANVAKAARAIADLVEAKYQVVITHSNGPQVGMIQTAMTEFARLDSKYTVAPMSLCSAMSQGYIGYDLQNAIRTELLNRGIYKTVSTIITQVKVDPFDRAFNNPTKVIGRYMTKEEAEAEEAKGNYVVEEEKGYRRIIAAPKPMDIYEIDAVRALLDAGQVVIAEGGGGIPVGRGGPPARNPHCGLRRYPLYRPRRPGPCTGSRKADHPLPGGPGAQKQAYSFISGR